MKKIKFKNIFIILVFLFSFLIIGSTKALELDCEDSIECAVGKYCNKKTGKCELNPVANGSCVCASELDASRKPKFNQTEGQFDSTHCPVSQTDSDGTTYLGCRWVTNSAGGSSAQTGAAATTAQSDISTDSLTSGVGNDSRCWIKSDCLEAQKTLRISENAQTSGLYRGTDALKACGETMINDKGEQEESGFCSPIGDVETSIKIGGRDYFSSMGDFLQYLYKYAVIVAGILAVVVILFAGVEWVTSAGSPEKTGSAKKRIGGALMGLFLALLSYTVLNLINPYLVNMRPPQAWMINAKALIPKDCDGLTQKLALAPKTSDGKLVASKDVGKITYSVDSKQAVCGEQYYVQNGGAITCTGSFCGEKLVCLNQGGGAAPCQPGALGGRISGSTGMIICPGDIVEPINNRIKLIAVCKSGNIDEVDSITITKSGQKNYLFKYSATLDNELAGNSCAPGDPLRGYFLGVEVNDDGGLMGNFCPGTGGSTGQSDWHAIGRIPGTHNCSVNLAKLAYRIKESKNPNCSGDSGISFCSCSSISLDDLMSKLVAKKDEEGGKEEYVNQEFVNSLISYEDLKQGFSCNISISRSEFPALDNSVSLGTALKSAGWAGVYPIYGQMYAVYKVFANMSSTGCWSMQDKFFTNKIKAEGNL